MLRTFKEGERRVKFCIDEKVSKEIFIKCLRCNFCCFLENIIFMHNTQSPKTQATKSASRAKGEKKNNK